MNRDRDQLSTREIASAMNERKEEQRREAVEDAPVAAAAAAAVTPAATAIHEDNQQLFPDTEISALRTRWEAIQTGFVDEPKAAVTEADALVAQVIARLAEVFSQEKAGLEQQWGRGGDVSTEDLRVALRRYRAFFSRLLAV